MKRTPGEAQEGSSTEDFPDWAVQQANHILDNEDAFQFILSVWQKKHVGDTNIGENCLCSFITSRILNSVRGLHIKPSGDSGKGKSDAIECFLELLPEDSYITGSMSAKALFYDKKLKPGVVIYSDDASFTEDVISTIKQSTSKFQKPTVHRTVVNGEAQTFTIPERETFWFSAVEGMDDEQLANRFLHANVDGSREQDERVHEHQKETEGWYDAEEVEPDVLVCRCILSILLKNFYRVKIPFIDAIEWNNKENRRNFDKFKDIIRAVTVYNCRKRENYEGFIMATPEDYERALKIYKGTSVNNATNLTDTEIKYLRFIVTRPNKTTTLKELVNHFKVSETAVRNMLNGKRGNGGLLSKIKQLIVIDSSSTVKGESTNYTTREKHYQYTGEFTGLDMYESISSLNYAEVKRVTTEFKAILYENKLRVTQGNLKGNLSRVTPKTDSSTNNNIINSRVIQNIKKESGEKFLPPGDENNLTYEKVSEFSQVIPLQSKQGYPTDINDTGSLKNEGNLEDLGKVRVGYPQPENISRGLKNEGYPLTDIEIYTDSKAVDMVTPVNSDQIGLLRRALVKFAKDEYNGTILDVDEFTRKFNLKVPEYWKALGRDAVGYNANQLRTRGWRM